MCKCIPKAPVFFFFLGGKTKQNKTKPPLGYYMHAWSWFVTEDVYYEKTTQDGTTCVHACSDHLVVEGEWRKMNSSNGETIYYERWPKINEDTQWVHGWRSVVNLSDSEYFVAEEKKEKYTSMGWRKLGFPSKMTYYTGLAWLILCSDDIIEGVGGVQGNAHAQSDPGYVTRFFSAARALIFAHAWESAVSSYPPKPGNWRQLTSKRWKHMEPLWSKWGCVYSLCLSTWCS